MANDITEQLRNPSLVGSESLCEDAAIEIERLRAAIDRLIEDAIGRKPKSAEERERIWKLLQDQDNTSLAMKNKIDVTMEAAQATLDAWPRHSDGRPVKIGEMTPSQRVVMARRAVLRLAPEFAAEGVSLEFKEAQTAPKKRQPLLIGTKPPARTKAAKSNKPKEFWTRGQT